MRRVFPDEVPAGTYLVFRLSTACTNHIPCAVSVMITEPISWSLGQAVCAIAVRGGAATYTQNYVYPARFHQPVPICVPVGMLSLESDWPQQYLYNIGTLYGVPNSTTALKPHYASDWVLQTPTHAAHNSSSVQTLSRLSCGDAWRCERILRGNTLFNDHQSPCDDHVWFLILGFAARLHDYEVRSF